MRTNMTFDRIIRSIMVQEILLNTSEGEDLDEVGHSVLMQSIHAPTAQSDENLLHLHYYVVESRRQEAAI